MSTHRYSLRINAFRMFLPAVLLVLAMSFVTGCQWFNSSGNLPLGQTGGPRGVVTVFFSKYQGSQSIVEDVTRKLPEPSKATLLQFALTELLKGPTPEEKSQGFYSEIPQGTQLIDLKQQGDTIVINLSRQFEEGGGSNSMQQRFEEVKRTILSVDSQHQIEIAVEGKKLEVLGGEGLEVEEALKRENR